MRYTLFRYYIWYRAYGNGCKHLWDKKMFCRCFLFRM